MITRPALTLAGCERMAVAALAEARRNGGAITIAILDRGGHLARMDGATPADAAIVAEKARTPARSRRMTRMWERRVAGEQLSMLRMPVLPVTGGRPIVVEGTCLGAVGASGVQAHKDGRIRQAGIEALLSRQS